MTRELTQDAIDLIKRWEGFRAVAYQDIVGKWTIGYGHTAGVRPGQTITKEAAERFLIEDLADAIQTVEGAVRVPLTDGQFGALVSFAFNVGPGKKGVKDGFTVLKDGRVPTFLRLLNARNYSAVPAALMEWTNAAGRHSPGVANRRAAECGLFVKGDHVAGVDVLAEMAPAGNAPKPTGPTVGATVGAAGGAVAAGSVAALAEHAGAVAPVLSALGHVPTIVGLTLIVMAGVAALLVWRPWRRA